MENKIIDLVVKEFKDKYPSSTSADLQTVVIACKLYQKKEKGIKIGGQIFSKDSLPEINKGRK